MEKSISENQYVRLLDKGNTVNLKGFKSGSVTVEGLVRFNEKFDLVFIDADKSNYINYFHLIINKMNSGGIILSDNVLWSGKVVDGLAVGSPWVNRLENPDRCVTLPPV